MPFGPKNSATEGFVIGLKRTSEFAKKNIIKIEDFALTEKSANIKITNKSFEGNFTNNIKTRV